ncbi:energy-coupling factor ABC transporter substrate-binding protein [Paenibacillus sp. HWE-109]|uniref:energy-coupling factor ABC transporter substrate-binding protein n=1 Tax=Paenibacillus sp. HWE-109 TaxID=1306526 RepID=UPI001EDD1BD7|nr:energy-coupling factor ABC transporter substrate-binding protein [Paenibacillus sp. HWE-109]UKS27686.1 energy-coupling factor ABC transporter substrate-binding protein [Paenibacillus sp. HWE-109]
MKSRTKNILMLIAIVLLAVLPLVLVNGEFGGADDAAEQLIQTIQPSYEPWFSSFFELPAETESMLFALQAAIGAGFIGFAFGLFKGRASKSKSQ